MDDLSDEIGYGFQNTIELSNTQMVLRTKYLKIIHIMDIYWYIPSLNEFYLYELNDHWLDFSYDDGCIVDIAIDFYVEYDPWYIVYNCIPILKLSSNIYFFEHYVYVVGDHYGNQEFVNFINSELGVEPSNLYQIQPIRSFGNWAQ